MMAFLRNWILALAGTACVCAMALAACPEGRVRRVLRLVCGAATAAALLSPVVKFDAPAYAQALGRYRQAAEAAASSAAGENDTLSRSIIQEKCAAYILDKADALGMEPGGTVRVRAEWSREDGCWLPAEAEIRISGSPEQISRLSAAVEAELGIPAASQRWGEG